MCDYITQDILKWTGHYVKNIRNGQLTISLQNLQIALNADKVRWTVLIRSGCRALIAVVSADLLKISCIIHLNS